MPYDTHADIRIDTKARHAPVSGNPFSVGTGFNALSFKHGMYAGAMDPLIMVDHFVMTEPTFGPHAHAGLSAVSILFEDSDGRFNNKDSLGNDIDLMPGDLYWMKAGGGAVHDEKPVRGARTHALQVFVNLPASMKYDAPASMHVKAGDMPVLTGGGYRARVMLGASNGRKGATSPALPMTVLDVSLQGGGPFEHTVPAGETGFVLAAKGEASVAFGGKTVELSPGQSVAFAPSDTENRLILSAADEAHIAVLQATPIREAFVQQGPFAMSTQAEVDAMFAAHKAGKLGRIEP